MSAMDSSGEPDRLLTIRSPSGAPSQVYAEMLTDPVRGSAEATALMGWMGADNTGA